MNKIAILVREETLQRCTGKGCLNAFGNRKDAFAGYGEAELVAFTHAGGDLDRKIEMLLKNGVDTVHLSSCMRAKASDYEAVGKKLAAHFRVIGYSHGPAEGKERATFVSDKTESPDRPPAESDNKDL
ncbi:MAG: CGGC domain-containing protein [Sporomusaceae bacterium]|nr:CGGC domain-containing protein [Sporomusaceae bacterium]